MAKTGAISVVACEREKRGNAVLTNQHGHVPSLVFRANQERAAGAEKRDITAALSQKRKCVSDVAVESFCATDGSRRRQFGICGVVGNFPKAQQVQHCETANTAHICATLAHERRLK